MQEHGAKDRSIVKYMRGVLFSWFWISRGGLAAHRGFKGAFEGKKTNSRQQKKTIIIIRLPTAKLKNSKKKPKKYDNVKKKKKLVKTEYPIANG